MYLIFLLLFPITAYAASIDVPVRATILNLNHMPVLEALQMCVEKGWECQGPCQNGNIQDVATAYNSCIEPGLAIRFLYDIIHVSMPFSQIIPPLPLPQSPKDCSIYLCLFCCLAYRVIVTIFLNSIYMR